MSVCVCVCARTRVWSISSVMSDSLRPDGLQPARLLVHGVLQARILEWVAMPPPGGLPDPGIELVSPALQVPFIGRWILNQWTTKEAPLALAFSMTQLMFAI